MKKALSAIVTILTAGLLTTSLTTIPAAGSEAEAAGLQISVVQTEVGSGSSRTITWTVTITDTQNRTFITSGTPTSTQILIERSSSRACVSAPVAFSANSLNSGSCDSYFTRLLGSDLSRISTSSGTVTYDLKSTDASAGTLDTYDSVLASTRTFGAVVAYLKFHTDSSSCSGFSGNNLCWNLYGSTGAWTPTAVAGISVVAGQGGPAGSGTTATAAPIKYSGPEFTSLSLRPVLSGTVTTLEGRKLDQISSITVDGKTAKISDASDKSLKLELPAGLNPGAHDLVVTTANHGKLTHMNAFRVREEMPATSLTIKGSCVLSGEEFKSLTAFARTQNPDMNTATCIVNSNSEGKSFMQARALCDRIAATNLNIQTTQFEVRSTVKSSAVFARVVFSSEQ
jgi:hypothetical protein